LTTLSLSQKIISGLREAENGTLPKNESYSYKILFLNHVVPDKSNSRYFPAIIIDDKHAEQFTKRMLTKHQLVKIYQGEGNVLVGKSCFINCLPYDSPEWRKVNKNIESITDLANNIKVSDLIQAPTIFPLENGQYQVLTGHRRFFALIYSNGNHGPTQFKVYDHPPLLKKIKQFQENASREDLPQYGKLCAFDAAKQEIDALAHANKQMGRKSISIREMVSIMGISMGSYDNFNVLTRYPCVMSAYEAGLSFSFIKTKKIVLQIETQFKKDHSKSVLNIHDKRNIEQQIKEALSTERAPTPLSLYRFKPVKSAKTIRTLLQSNIMSLSTGIDWDEIDWDDAAEVSQILNLVIEFLEQ
jgi:hypothetical protein